MLSNIAFNPIPWYLTKQGWHPELAPPLPQILSAIRAAGYAAVHAQVPEGMTPASYLALLQEHDLRPAPGYLTVNFSHVAELAANIENARLIAAEHAALGLDRIFLADVFGISSERMTRPAQGADFDEARLSRLVEGADRVAHAMAAEGVIPCLHQHVGSWIETERETTALLDAISSDVLLLGPDTAHLLWAGIKPELLIARYQDRIGAVHVKDIHLDIAHLAHDTGLTYRQAVAANIWTEPGCGDVDFDAVFAALGDFNGWFVVEVDIPDQPTIEASARISLEWLEKRLMDRGRG